MERADSGAMRVFGERVYRVIYRLVRTGAAGRPAPAVLIRLNRPDDSGFRAHTPADTVPNPF